MEMRRIESVLFLALAGLVAVSCGDRKAVHRDVIHTVVLTRPTALSTSALRSVAGTVEESAETAVGFKTGGQIARVNVKEGDYVSRGQLIATLDDSDYKLGVDAARIQYEQMERQVARMKKLHDAHSISGNDYDKAVSGLEQLKVQLDANTNKLDYCKLHSPVSGYVRSVNFSVGEMVGAGTPLVDIINSGDMSVAADVSSAVYDRRGEISSVFCVLPDGGRIPMKISSITPKADGNQLYRMRLSIPSAESSRLTAGMNVEVEISLGEASGKTGVTVPEHSVFQSDGKTYVWVIGADSTVSKRAVVDAGLDDKGNIVISNGLDGSEQIVKAGVDALSDGEKVRIFEQ